MENIHEIVGAIHIHSSHSDGTLDIPDIARWADEAGLDYLLFSDHHTLKPKKEGLEGCYGRTLALIGYETSDQMDHNHYLVFQLDDIAPGLYAREYIEEIRRRGGLGIIAHPVEKRDPEGEYPPYPWTAWECEDFDGIEIWNQLSEWTEGLTKTNRINRFMHPLKSLVAPPPELLKKWDELATQQRVIGIAGVDAHCFRVKFLKLLKVRIFHYKVTFKSLRNHLLLTEPFPRDNPDKAGDLLFEAIRRARLFISNHRRGDAGGFRFQAVSGDKTALMGDSLDSDEAVFQVKSPLKAEITLLHDGKIAASAEGKELEYRADTPGVYRVEAKRNGQAWVFTNHIYLSCK